MSAVRRSVPREFRQDGAVLLDLRTVEPARDDALAAAVRDALAVGSARADTAAAAPG